jgi:hypothetical protein
MVGSFDTAAGTGSGIVGFLGKGLLARARPLVGQFKLAFQLSLANMGANFLFRKVTGAS